MRGLDYNDPTWDSLLDQLTVEDYDVSINRGGYGTVQLESVGKPYNVDADTASYLIYGGTGQVTSSTVAPATPLRARRPWRRPGTRSSTPHLAT